MKIESVEAPKTSIQVIERMTRLLDALAEQGFRRMLIEGGSHTVLLPSGLAAVTLVDLALLRAGDEVLIPDNAYGPGKDLARTELARWGIRHRFYDPMDVASLAAALSPATKLVWLEAAGSVTMEFPDLVALVQLCKARGVLCALDNTWGAGLAFNAFDLTSCFNPAHGCGLGRL